MERDAAMTDLSHFSIGRAVKAEREIFASGVDWGHVEGFTIDPDTYRILVTVRWSDATSTNEDPEVLS